MRLKAAVAFVVWSLAAAGQAQTVPCEVPVDQLSVNPKLVAAELTEHTTMVLGTTTPLVSGYEVRIYQEVVPRATAPFAVVQLPREAWTLVPGTAACYTATMPDVPSLARNIKHRATLIALGSHGLNSEASEESNPFGWVGPPRVTTKARLGR
jgi:hypothetical protein